MDITNIPQNLVKALEQKSTDQLAALSKVLNLVLGKTVMANVVSTAPVTAQEREELLKQTTAALTQLNQQSVGKLTPAIKNEITRLLQQHQLVQSPELKWINLVVNNRTLLTYSDRPLVAGQTIPVQLQGPQKLVLVDMPESDALELTPNKTGTTPNTTATNSVAIQQLIKATQTTNTATVAQPGDKALGRGIAENISNSVDTTSSDKLIKTVVEKNLANFTQAEPTNKSAPQQKINLYAANDLALKASPQNAKQPSSDNFVVKQIVGEQLRSLLPHRDTPNTLLSAVVQLNNLPRAAKSTLLSPNLEQALKSIAEKIRSPEQLANPKVLAQTLKNSGVFFESALNKQASTQTTSQHQAHAVNNTYSHDLKGSLLTLLNRATQELSGSTKPVSAEQTVRLFQNLGSIPLTNQSGLALTLNNKQDLTQAVGMFIQELMQKPVKELSNKELRAQLLVMLQQHSLHSLAKIQLQQLHSLNHELDTRDSTTPAGSWQIEIPVKHHNDIHPLHMRIDREWVDEKNESETDKSPTKIKQWSVTLRFDLPTLGEFCAQLSIINTQVSATLWAAREKTFTEVRDHMEGLRQQLENEGINVKFLQCMRGMPAQKPMALSYSLIDIST